MVEVVEMTRTVGLELLETLLLGYSPLFYHHDQCRMLLKERVCSLVIKLFSPNIKYRGGGSGSPGMDQSEHSITRHMIILTNHQVTPLRHLTSPTTPYP